MGDGVFDQRLKGKGGDAVRLRRDLALDPKDHAVEKTGLLNVHITVQNIQLLLDGYAVLPGIQVVAEQDGQLLNQGSGFIRVFPLRGL